MDIKDQVDRSGFPLQLAIANQVKKNLSYWTVLYEEHQWSNDKTDGFIDLVLEDQNRTWLMNVECKRVQNSSWIFLLDRDSKITQSSTRLWVSYRSSEKVMEFFDWVDIPMAPECEESTFCVVPGQDSKSTPMLERVASSVVLSTEALAKDEAVSLDYFYSNLRMYQNVIVTTAELQTCHMDVGSIDISTGKIKEDTKFNVVPFVRFRKQLGATTSDNHKVQHGRDVEKLISQRESTVFVVNSAHFLDFLSSCELSGNIEKIIRGAR